MNYPGVISADSSVLDKLMVAALHGKPIDGHSPRVSGHELNAYASAGILTDHECTTAEEMLDRISRGMYVLLRLGSACHDLPELIRSVTPLNSRRCLLCSDDCQPKTILSEGHLNCHMRLCVAAGLDPIVAIQMASLNAAECYGLKDRGAIKPGLRADIVLLDDLKDFHAQRVFIAGREVAVDRRYLPEVTKHDISAVRGRFRVRDFSVEKLRLKVNSGRAHVITMMSGGIVTRNEIAEITRDENGCFVYAPDRDIVKIAVIERHHNTGNVAVALLKDYGLKRGAIALSIAHDSHNIIVVGTNDADMAYAVERLIEQDGGIVLVHKQNVLESLPMPIAGLMSDRSGEWVDEKLTRIHRTSVDVLGVRENLEPVMQLCFMALPVIPEIKLTDMGLFDVTKFDFISIEA